MSNHLNDIRADAPTRHDDPEAIRRDIESTRTELSRNVDALTEKVSPGRVVGRRVDRAKDGFTSMKERVMGSSTSAHDNGPVGSVRDQASSVASSVRETAGQSPTFAREKAQGNPLAAGLVAFGVGWLASSMLPATKKEQEAADAAKDMAGEHSDALTTPLKEAAGGAKDNLAGPVQDAVQAVRDRATDAAGAVRAEASSAADDVAGSARHAKDSVQPGATS